MTGKRTLCFLVTDFIYKYYMDVQQTELDFGNYHFNVHTAHN